MTFLAPWLLAALPAAGVPVIIHLLNRGKPRPIRWAAMQFLLDSVRKNQRRLQLRDLILLILRILIILLLVLLFACPAIWVAVGSSGAVPSPVAGMIVLDVSASMVQSDGRRSRLESAREEALKTLEKFSADSVCGLILATDRAVPVVPRPSGNLELVREKLNAARETSSATNLLPAIERAFQELVRSESAEKIIFVYTDSQESAWRESPAIRDLAGKYPGISLRSVAVGGPGEPNSAITGMTIQPSSPTVGEVAQVRIDVRNFTDKPIDGVRVTLAANRDKPQDETTLPQIPPGKSASANLKIVFDNGGLQTLRAEIPKDLFPVDNIRSLAIQVGNPRKFLLVAETVGGDQRLTPAFFLRTALGITQKGATVKVVSPVQLTQAEVDGTSAILVSSPSGMDDAQWALLEKYALGGGGIVVFPDTQSSANLGETPATRWLPGTLGSNLPQAATWVQAGLGHPVTAAWADSNRTRLTNISADKRSALAPHEGAAPLAKYSDAVPVAVSLSVGAGKAVLFGTSPAPSSTNLVLHPFFPILLGSLMDYLAVEKKATPDLRPGEAFSANVPPSLIGSNVFLVSDRSDKREAAGVVVSAEAGGRIQIPSVDNPGGYRVLVEGSEDPVAAFSVAIDASESLLATTAPVDMESGNGKAATPVATGGAKVPQEVWTIFAVLLLLTFTAEMVLLHRIAATR